MDRLVHDLPDLFEEVISTPPWEYIIKMFPKVAVTMYLMSLTKQLRMWIPVSLKLGDSFSALNKSWFATG